MFEEVVISWRGLVLAFFSGVVCGWVIVCLCLAASNADDEMDRIHDQFPEEGHF